MKTPDCERELLLQVQEARLAFGAEYNKLAGSVTVEVLRSFLLKLGVPVSARDVFIRGVPVEIDLLIPSPTATPRHELIYEPSDVRAAFEVKNRGAFPGATAKIRQSFDLIRSSSPSIYCAYITLSERKTFKEQATAENLGADVYTLFWHKGSNKNRRYDPTEDWGRLTKKLTALPFLVQIQTDV
jgi:hypothetical protein